MVIKLIKIRSRIISKVGLILLFTLIHSKIYAQLSGKSLGYIYNENGIEIELLVIKPKETCSETGKDWIYRLYTKNLFKADRKLTFINWKLRVKNCSNYLIERSFSIDINSSVNFRNDGIKGNSHDWKFEAQSIESNIIDGGFHYFANNELDKNLSFLQKLMPPDTIMGLKAMEKGQLNKLSIDDSNLDKAINWVWYSNECGSGTPIFKGTEFIFIPTRDMEIFVRAEQGDKKSDCKKVEIKVYERSIPPLYINTSDGKLELYLGEMKRLGFSGGRLGTNAKWVWYEKIDNDRKLIGYSDSITIDPKKTTVFEVRAEGEFGISDFKSITINVIEEELFWTKNNTYLNELPCIDSQNLVKDKQINNLVYSILNKLNNNIDIQLLECNNILNCKAVVADGNYLLFNPIFIKSILSINFKELTNIDYENLYILAHEISYFLNEEILTQNKNSTCHKIELKTDSINGELLFHMGLNLEQIIYYFSNSNYSLIDFATSRFPSKINRLKSTEIGFNEAMKLRPIKIEFKIEDEAEKPFKCGFENLLDINGNEYKTILIGTQCWMQENLNVSNYRNGAVIPEVLSSSSWVSLKTGGMVYYNNLSEENFVYGKLYNWYAIDNKRGICPKGWDLPTNSDWDLLISNLGGDLNAGGKMKSKGTSYWKSPNLGATNESYFNGLPGGNRNEFGDFNNLGISTFWWSANEFDFNNAWFYNINFNFGQIKKINYSKNFAYSVRCIKNNNFKIITPKVTTLAVSDIKEYSFIAGGEIISDGGALVKARGVIWSESENSNLELHLSTKSFNGDGFGKFSSSINNLLPNTTYYLRAYATNIAGTGYGDIIEVKTLAFDTTIKVLTSAVINIGSGSVKCGGVIMSSTIKHIIETGLYISEDNYFINETKKVINPNSNSNSNFQLEISNLNYGKTYWLKAFIKTNSGLVFGQANSIFIPFPPNEIVENKQIIDKSKIDFLYPKFIINFSPYFQSNGINEYWLRNNEIQQSQNKTRSNVFSDIFFDNNFYLSINFSPFTKTKEKISSYSKLYFDFTFFKSSFVLEEENKNYNIISSKFIYPISDKKDIFLDTENFGAGIIYRYVNSFFSFNIQTGTFFSNLILRFQKRQYHFNYKIPLEIESYVKSKTLFSNAKDINNLNFYSNLNIGLGMRKGLSFNFGIGFLTMVFDNPNHRLYNSLYPKHPISNSTTSLIPNIKGSITVAF
jgi:uncharacterized protein (TIGR02145 family)